MNHIHWSGSALLVCLRILIQKFVQGICYTKYYGGVADGLVGENGRWRKKENKGAG